MSGSCSDYWKYSKEETESIDPDGLFHASSCLDPSLGGSPARKQIPDLFFDGTPTGSIDIRNSEHAFRGLEDYININANDLWERMYIKPQPVIITCVACGSHNATSNPTCVQCGAPMGWSSKEKNRA